MRNNCEFDEKQLYDRGVVYRYAFIIALVTNVVIAMLKDICHVQATVYWEMSVGLWIPVTACLIMLILKDAYDGIDSNKGCGIVSLIGVMGAILLVTDIVRLVLGQRSLVDQGVLSDACAYLVIGISMISICTVYWAKHYYNKKRESKYED